ncbi:MAG: hypothetical protein KF861_11825 [Planctomycetaceae bacterium]|nr:hypothetical protein [Planctomycetaceae bacterium]
MNKAFVREPEADGRAYCPRCGSLGTPVVQETLDHHVCPAARPNLGESAWFCAFPECDIAYFDLFERSVEVSDLNTPVYPKSATAPICACFGLMIEEIEADAHEGVPTRIRELLAKSQSNAAQCHRLAADGRCCMREVQRLYLRQVADRSA